MCQAQSYGFAMPFSPQKVSRLETTRIYNGKNMPHSDLSFRALSVLHTSRYLLINMAFTKSGLTELLNLQKRLKPLFIIIFTQKNASLK